MNRTIYILLAAFALATGEARAVDGPGREGAVNPLLLKMKESRDRLRSGSYTASGKVVKGERFLIAEPWEGDVDILSAFDFDKGLFRFDRTESVIRDGVVGQEVYKSIRSRDSVVTWEDPFQQNGVARQKFVIIRPATAKLPSGFSPWDWRSVGLILWEDFKRGRPFEETSKTWLDSRHVDVIPEAKGIYRLVLRLGRSGSYTPQTLWIDENQGFSPIRLTHAVPSGVDGGPERIMYESTASWTKVSGGGFPKSVRLRLPQPVLKTQVVATVA